MLLILLALAAVSAYYFVIYHFSLWERRKIPYEKPKIPFGSMDGVRKRERSFGFILADIYQRTKEPLVGIYLFFRPTILICDAELARTIMTTDFASFHDRGIYVDEEHDEINANLFALRGQSWRTLRAKLTPSFTSGKLKGMFGTIDDVSDKMVKYLNGELPTEGSQLVDVRNLFTTYAIDVIASVIFGLDVDSFVNPNNEFRSISNQLLQNNGKVQAIMNVASFFFPPIAKLITRLGFKSPIMLELRDIIKRTIEFREKNKIIRKDLLQLLIQLRNTGKISEDDDKLWDIETAAESLKSMSIDSIAAQAFVFYIAGSETTAATAAFTIYELAMYPELLKKAQNEVTKTLKKHNISTTDKLTHDALQDMKFMDLCIMESMRKYPGLPFLNRECTKDYPVPGTSYTIEKGTPIIISLFGMHRDPQHFPDPLRYDPERYLEENGNYNPVAYMPFGDGPRHCIAQRMGKINVKFALVKFLTNFDIEPIEHHEIEFEFDPAPALLKVKGGLNVRLSKKKHT